MAKPTKLPAGVRSQLAVAIRQRRKRLGVSQEELAWRAGLHRTYLSDVERGARNPSLESIEKLARALKAPISSLFAEAEEGTTSKADPKRCGHGSTRVDILLVEDDPDDVALTLEAFRSVRLKNRVHVVRDGVAAMEFLLGPAVPGQRRPKPRPLVVLLDLNLPKLNGLELLRLLKANPRTARIPVIVLTGSHSDQDVEECRRLGVHYYIVKPVDFRNLVRITPLLQLDLALLQDVSQEAA